jgi:hypothetical protein
MATSYYPQPGTPNIIVIGVPNLDSLNRVLGKLTAKKIPHHAWVEPDNDLGFTAIATVPIDGAERAALANYRLWKETRPCSSNPEQPVLSGKDVGWEPTRGANNCS